LAAKRCENAFFEEVLSRGNLGGEGRRFGVDAVASQGFGAAGYEVGGDTCWLTRNFGGV
jgi:hypothetical protein